MASYIVQIFGKLSANSEKSHCMVRGDVVTVAFTATLHDLLSFVKNDVLKSGIGLEIIVEKQYYFWRMHYKQNALGALPPG